VNNGTESPHYSDRGVLDCKNAIDLHNSTVSKIATDMEVTQSTYGSTCLATDVMTNMAASSVGH